MDKKKSEFTKGELKIGGKDPEGRLIVSAYSDDNEFPCTPVAIMEYGVAPTKKQAQANAKELVRRWNAFEKDGLVDDLLTTCETAEKELSERHNAQEGSSIDKLVLRIIQAAIKKAQI